MQGIIENDWSTVKRDVLQSTSDRESIGCQEAYPGDVMVDFHPIKLLSLHRPLFQNVEKGPVHDLLKTNLCINDGACRLPIRRGIRNRRSTPLEKCEAVGSKSIRGKMMDSTSTDNSLDTNSKEDSNNIHPARSDRLLWAAHLIRSLH